MRTRPLNLASRPRWPRELNIPARYPFGICVHMPADAKPCWKWLSSRLSNWIPAVAHSVCTSWVHLESSLASWSWTWVTERSVIPGHRAWPTQRQSFLAEKGRHCCRICWWVAVHGPRSSTSGFLKTTRRSRRKWTPSRYSVPQVVIGQISALFQTYSLHFLICFFLIVSK